MLTDRECRTATPREKAWKLSDANGLFLLIRPSSHKSWHLKYRWGGQEKRITFGPYPEISLKQAREKRDAARTLLREGQDPGVAHRQKTSRRRLGVDPESTFESLARRWLAQQAPGWTAKHHQLVEANLMAEAFPTLGKMPAREIQIADVRNCILSVQNRGAIETAHRLRGRISAIFALAMSLGLASADPTTSLSAALMPIKKGRRPAILKIEPLRMMLQSIETSPGLAAPKLASRLLALTAARPGMVRYMEPHELEDLNGSEPLWRVPAEKMKLDLERKGQDAFEFVIPLSRQAVEVILAARELAHNPAYVFPGEHSARRPMNENALNYLYRGNPMATDRHVPHGWRASFSTIMNERAIAEGSAGDRAIIDLMLAHVPSGVESLYNRAAYMPRRRELAQLWADMLLQDAPPASSMLGSLRN